MRVISGSKRGMKLKTLEGNSTRPTTDKIKEAVFSMIQFEIKDKIVLDLFSGSGALGIEALSRGAKFSYFVDNNKKAIEIIKENIIKSKFSNYKLINKDANKLIKNDYSKVINEKVDIIFLDPPYNKNIITNLINNILEHYIINDGGLIVVESSLDENLDNVNLNNLEILKIKEYKITKIIIYKCVNEKRREYDK